MATTTGVRRSRRALRSALAAVTVCAAIGLTPGVATASPPYKPTGAVRPVLECVSRDSDGNRIAVLGYLNKGGPKTIPRGPWNTIAKTQYDGSQPTVYKGGTQHGVLSLKIAADDYTSGAATWILDGNLVFIGAAFDSGIPPCRSVQMPAEGNDTGAAIVLVAAGVIGALVVLRERRRALAAGFLPAVGPAVTRNEHTDA